MLSLVVDVVIGVFLCVVGGGVVVVRVVAIFLLYGDCCWRWLRACFCRFSTVRALHVGNEI